MRRFGVVWLSEPCAIEHLNGGLEGKRKRPPKRSRLESLSRTFGDYRESLSGIAVKSRRRFGGQISVA